MVRRFKAPARLGVNRAAWDLGRDPFKRFPRGEDAVEEDEDERSGPEVPPGRYEITLKFREHEARTSVEVLADPRSTNTVADWQKRYEAQVAIGSVSDRTADAVWRLRRTRDDVGIVQQKAREAAEATGEKDKKKLAELPLVKDGESLKEAIGKLEKRLWQSPETRGLLPDTDVDSRVGLARYYLGSAWAPPSPTQLQYLKRAETELDAFLKDMEAFFAKDVAAYRAKVAEAKVALLP